MQTNIKFYIAIILLISRLSRSFFDFLKFFRTANLKKTRQAENSGEHGKRGRGLAVRGRGAKEDTACLELYGFADAGFLGVAGLLPYRRTLPPVGAPGCPVGWLFEKCRLFCRTAGYRLRAAPFVRFHSLSRIGVRLNKFSSLGACGSHFWLSDRCRRSSSVAAPKIIHRMIFVCDARRPTLALLASRPRPWLGLPTLARLCSLAPLLISYCQLLIVLRSLRPPAPDPRPLSLANYQTH